MRPIRRKRKIDRHHLRIIRRSREIAPTIALFLLALIGAVLALAVFNRPEKTSNKSDYRIVQRVVDGNTLVLENGELVRLIGVDTPATKPKKPVQLFSEDATAFTRRMVEGKRVRLEFDIVIRYRDLYGHTLAYVLLEDGTLLNAEIIKQGYGRVYVLYPFSKMEEFRRLQREARQQGRGPWQLD
jgi:micrococcal nuclease